MTEKTPMIIEKIFLAVCVTDLAMIVLFFSFGGCCIMGKGIRFWVAVATGVIFLVSVFICLFYCDDNDCKKFCHEYHCPCLKSADDRNNVYWLDIKNCSDKIPSDKRIIVISDGTNIEDIDFSKLQEDSVVFFYSSDISLTEKQYEDLKKAKAVFIGAGETSIKIQKGRNGRRNKNKK
ncbi:MAG: hypothetical protein HUK25_04575 [Treponema sp.]|nr:hypothetical protein [Treponema sp.]